MYHNTADRIGENNIHAFFLCALRCFNLSRDNKLSPEYLGKRDAKIKRICCDQRQIIC